MPFRKLHYTLKANDRNSIRREITNLFLNEEPGIGRGDDSSKYHYVVEHYGDYTIELHRPAGLNKGFDFTVHISGMHFKKNRRYTNPSHQDILDCLSYIKENYSTHKYEIIKRQIKDIFDCKNPNPHETDGMFFVDYDGTDRPAAIIILAAKWLFIEQDITYWNWSGRNMLRNKMNEEGLI